MSKNDEFCIKCKEFCIRNKGLWYQKPGMCIKNKEFCISNDEFCRNGRDFLGWDETEGECCGFRHGQPERRVPGRAHHGDGPAAQAPGLGHGAAAALQQDHRADHPQHGKRTGIPATTWVPGCFSERLPVNTGGGRQPRRPDRHHGVRQAARPRLLDLPEAEVRTWLPDRPHLGE